MEKDPRIGKTIIATITLEDGGQDFLELDVLENGVLLGNSILFADARITLLGIGTADGTEYITLQELQENVTGARARIENIPVPFYVYHYKTGEKEPLPWNASVFNYCVESVKRPTDPNRFVK